MYFHQNIQILNYIRIQSNLLVDSYNRIVIFVKQEANFQKHKENLLQATLQIITVTVQPTVVLRFQQ